MTKIEALQMCLEYIETDKHERKYVRHAIKAALEQPVQEPTDIAALVEGMEVSIDASTGEHDSDNRLFGTVTLAQENQGSKHGLILLIQDAEPNFQPASPEQEPAIGDIRGLKHQIHALEGEVLGYKKILDALPEQEPVALRDALAETLGGIYGCSRHWSAWNVGTMSQRDFYPAAESDELLDELVQAVAAATPPLPVQEPVNPTAQEMHNAAANLVLMKEMFGDANHTTSPQRPWVGLTDEEIWSADPRIGTSDSNVNPYQILKNARVIEAMLKERNHD
jgi:hypothetical protein